MRSYPTHLHRTERISTCNADVSALRMRSAAMLHCAATHPVGRLVFVRPVVWAWRHGAHGMGMRMGTRRLAS